MVTTAVAIRTAQDIILEGHSQFLNKVIKCLNMLKDNKKERLFRFIVYSSLYVIFVLQLKVLHIVRVFDRYNIVVHS